ncbi:hypothetical protein EVG20_g235 [Dentipellis fragilis]|uniref:Uncharacterized protein n=1 Tax=Dentipellis fragilis TaxID=205917 RepID=A0A4Y9ZG41_9AGAM|nr:hypothetical protein EVG20_g235 [Dentipellis fragilis]
MLLASPPFVVRWRLACRPTPAPAAWGTFNPPAFYSQGHAHWARWQAEARNLREQPNRRAVPVRSTCRRRRRGQAPSHETECLPPLVTSRRTADISPEHVLAGVAHWHASCTASSARFTRVYAG